MLAPPKRASASAPSTRPATPDTWKTRMKARGSVWGKKAVDKSVAISDSVGGRVNSFAETRLGTHAFWPVTGDFGAEMDKCATILREFTVDGIVTEDKKTKRKILRKIPPSVIANAKGLAIFTSMRSGFAPLGGAGGTGVVVARLPDGSWSPPASISPNNLSAGLLIGVDIFDCILVIRTQKALDSFAGHKVTLGGEIGVAAGPWGAGAVAEMGRERAPVLSYLKSKGMYAGVEAIGQVFVSRFEENAAMYNWPGIKAGDILAGKVRMPLEAADLVRALQEASSGVAQTKRTPNLDTAVDPDAASTVVLEDGEVLKLPPTPTQTDGHEYESDSETERIIRRSGQFPPRLPPRREVGSLPLPGSSSHDEISGLDFDAEPQRHSFDIVRSPGTPTPPRSPKSTFVTTTTTTVIAPPPPLPPRSAKRLTTDAPPGYDAPSYTPSNDSPSHDTPSHDAPSHASSEFLQPGHPERPDLSPASSYGSASSPPDPSLVTATRSPSPEIAPQPEPGITPGQTPGILIPSVPFTPVETTSMPGSPGCFFQHAQAKGSGLRNEMPHGPSEAELAAMDEGERREWEEHFAAIKLREDESLR